MNEQTRLKVGDNAPEFELKNQHNDLVKSTELRGRKILLSFHPLAWTSVCENQMKSLEESRERFDELNMIVFGVSIDSAPTKKAWADQIGIEHTQLLSDFWPHGGVAQAFGIFRENDGFSERANIVIDEDGKITFFRVYDVPELPDIQEVIQSLL